MLRLKDLLDLSSSLAEQLPESMMQASTNEEIAQEFTPIKRGKIGGWLKKKLESYFYPSRWYAFDELASLIPADNFTEEKIASHVCCNPEAKWIIFGDIRGSFHSLVRDLVRLNELGLLNEHLQLQGEEDRIVFMGNVFFDPPYSLETLILVLSLMSQNPERVVYIKGDAENGEEWLNTGLRYELGTYASSFLIRDLPFYKELRAFFSSLPELLYLQIPNARNLDTLRISYFPPAQIGISKKHPARYVKAALGSSNGKVHYITTKGLKQIPAHGVLCSWSLFSGPTPRMQKETGFIYDSFAILKPTEETIEHHYRKIGEGEKFRIEEHNLLSGIPKLMTKEKPVLIGCSLDLVKTSSVLGQRLRDGIHMAFSKGNLEGGVDGREVLPIFLNDSYTPIESVENVYTFKERFHTDIIFSSLGTPTTESFAHLAQEKEILILFPYTGSTLFRQKQLKNIYHFRTSYKNEAQALIHHAIETSHCKKFALFYQDDSYGLAGVEGARAMFQKRNIENWLEASYVRNSPNVELAAEKILSFDPDVILFFSTLAPSIELIHLIGVEKLVSKHLMGISFLTDAFRHFLSSKGLSFTLSRVVPNPNDRSIPLVEEYLSETKKYYGHEAGNCDTLEGYLNGMLLLELFKNHDGDFSKEWIAQKIESLHDYDFKGLSLSFNPETKELFDKVWIDTGSPIWLPGILS